jgi:hypothetical protein
VVKAGAGQPSGPAAAPKPLPVGKLRELEERLQQKKGEGAAKVDGLKQESRGAGMGIWWMIIMYVVFHLIFQN